MYNSGMRELDNFLTDTFGFFIWLFRILYIFNDTRPRANVIFTLQNYVLLSERNLLLCRVGNY